VGCSALILGAILYGLNVPLTGAVIVGIGLALSSTAVVLPVLAEQKRAERAHGPHQLRTVLLFQTWQVVAPVLFAIAVLGRDDGGDKAGALAMALGQAAIALVLIVVAGRLALRPLFQLVARTRSTELFMAACLLVIVGTGADRGGERPVDDARRLRGRPAAGRDRVPPGHRGDDRPVSRACWLGVFFVSVGMNLDPAQLMATPGAIIGLSLALVLIKAAVVMMAAPVLKIPRPVALETALLLGPGGEFGATC
jgi:CPA2 family monovalent cation:H+ antiporter-2